MKSKIFGMLLIVIVASIMAVTPVHSQNVMASAYAGQTHGSTRISDVDVAEAVEAGNATTMVMTNQTTTDGNMTDVQFLFIQNAQSGSISQINETAYTLELNNVANNTIQFSDRPNRIVETVSTADFIGNWSTGPDSFALDAPNDALIVEDIQTGNLETAVTELFDPLYDATANILTYTIVGENGTSIDLPSEFGRTILVVDSELPPSCIRVTTGSQTYERCGTYWYEPHERAK